MSYVKQTFNEGDKLKAEHLNHIEDGLYTVDNNVKSIKTELKETADISEAANVFSDNFRDALYLSRILTPGIKYYTSLYSGYANLPIAQKLKFGQFIEVENTIETSKAIIVYKGNSATSTLFFDYIYPGKKRIYKVESEWSGISIPVELKAKIYYSNNKPLILNSDKVEEYDTNSKYGDEALRAIVEGRQVLVRVPNADGNNYTAIYSPVYMYQVPNNANDYLYLFYLRDEKNSLDLTALGMGAIELPVYGELKMKLSETYNFDPLNEYTYVYYNCGGLEITGAELINESRVAVRMGDAFTATFSLGSSNRSFEYFRIYMNDIDISSSVVTSGSSNGIGYKKVNIPVVTGPIKIYADTYGYY